MKNKLVFIPFLLISTIASGCTYQNSGLQNQPIIPSLTPTSSTTNRPASSTISLDDIFGLSKKTPETKLFYSDKLGIGFTYTPFSPDDKYHLPNDEIKVTERGNIIYLGYVNQKDPGYSIEVFSKDPKLTLEEAIQQKFLARYNPKDCFVKSYSSSIPPDSAELNFVAPASTKYLTAGIAYPRSSDSSGGDPWFKNAEKCPTNYSEYNTKQYFLMNPEVPSKFIFIKAGNLSITSDGTPSSQGGSFDWSDSVRIVK